MASRRRAQPAQALLERLPAITYIAAADDQGGTQWISPQIEPVLGFTPEAWVSDPGRWGRQVHAEDRDRVLQAWSRSAAEGRPFEAEYRMIARDGKVVWFRDQAAVASNGDGTSFVYGVMFEITARKHAEDELRRAQEERTRFLERLVSAQDDERRRIAGELHDDVGQLLTGAKLMLQAKRPMDEVLPLLDGVTTRIQDLCSSLRPPLLDELGLLPALRWHIEQYRGYTGIRVSFRHAGLARLAGDETGMAAFRIVQEALTNAARHARTRRAHVGLVAGRRRLVIRVEDWGCGFDPRAAFARESPGLNGMHERARLLGGTLNVDSRPGRGTRVEAVLPLPPRRRAEPGL